jgi:S-phase kinase-associated protein 1
MTFFLTLTSSDGIKVQVDSKSAEKSGLLKGLIQDYSQDDEIPVPDVRGDVLKKVVEFLVHWKDGEPKSIPKPLPSANLKDVTDEWNADFIMALELPFTYDIINAANYMDVKPLLELSCAKVASLMKNKTVEQIRDYFNIPIDMTEEDQKKMEEEYRQEKLKKQEEQRLEEENREKLEKLKVSETTTEKKD